MNPVSDHGECARIAFRHMPALDGVRAVAILMVLSGHMLTFSLHFSSDWGAVGGAGVVVFFVLSGFLITGLLCNEEARSGTVNVFGFYRDRALRILPAFFVLLAVTSLLMGLNLVTDVPWYSIAVCALFLRNIFGRGDELTHIWSLSLEQQFYTLWPLFVRWIKCRSLFPWALGSVIVITLWRMTAIVLDLWSYETGRFNVRPDFRIDSILLGCCLALLLYRPGEAAESGMARGRRLWRLAQWAHPVWVLPAFIGWTVGFCSSVPCRPYFVTGQMFFAGLLLLNVVVCPQTAWARLLSVGALRQIGAYSYSIYLWQQIFLVMKTPDWGWVRAFPYDVIGACAAGIASYYLVERPFLKWKAKLKALEISQDAPLRSLSYES